MGTGPGIAGKKYSYYSILRLHFIFLMIVGVIGSVWLHDSVIIIMQGGYSVLVELSRLKLSPEDAAGWVRRRQGQG